MSLNLPHGYQKNILEDGSIEITTYGDLRAKFIKIGRAFDVEFRLTPGEGKEEFDKKKNEIEKYLEHLSKESNDKK